jgi:hypothetical protein
LDKPSRFGNKGFGRRPEKGDLRAQVLYWLPEAQDVEIPQRERERLKRDQANRLVDIPNAKPISWGLIKCGHSTDEAYF